MMSAVAGEIGDAPRGSTGDGDAPFGSTGDAELASDGRRRSRRWPGDTLMLGEGDGVRVPSDGSTRTRTRGDGGMDALGDGGLDSDRSRLRLGESSGEEYPKRTRIGPTSPPLSLTPAPKIRLGEGERTGVARTVPVASPAETPARSIGRGKSGMLPEPREGPLSAGFSTSI